MNKACKIQKHENSHGYEQVSLIKNRTTEEKINTLTAGISPGVLFEYAKNRHNIQKAEKKARADKINEVVSKDRRVTR